MQRVLDNNLIRDKLLSGNFDELSSIQCSIKLYIPMYNLFSDIYNSSYVLKKVNMQVNRDNKPWVTQYLKNLTIEKDRLFMILKIWLKN